MINLFFKEQKNNRLSFVEPSVSRPIPPTPRHLQREPDHLQIGTKLEHYGNLVVKKQLVQPMNHFLKIFFFNFLGGCMYFFRDLFLKSFTIKGLFYKCFLSMRYMTRPMVGFCQSCLEQNKAT